MQPLISLKNVVVTRGGRRLLGPLTHILFRYRHLAVTGANGAGKTTFLRLLRGEVPPAPGGERYYDFGQGAQASVLGLRQRIAMVSVDMQDFYFQHARRVTGRELVLAGAFDSPILYQLPLAAQEVAAEGAIRQCGLMDIADRELGTLSTGQVRKILLARSLAYGPEVLLLDECLDGLDRESRIGMLDLLEMAAERATLVCAAHREDDLPDCIRETLHLDSGKVMDGADGHALEKIPDLPVHTPDDAAFPIPASLHEHEYLVHMENVSVVAGGNRILDGINWRVRPGEHWLVTGANGAGKSTLLKLIAGTVHPYADAASTGTVRLFDGMSMEDARPLIGVVSPEEQAAFGRRLQWEVTVEETVMSGYRGANGLRGIAHAEAWRSSLRWLELVGLGGQGMRPLRQLSYGQQRRVFLARVMAAGPRLLLLDEPFSGLDALSRRAIRGMVEYMAGCSTTIVLVTHHDGDRIPSINHIMALEFGMNRFCGTWHEYGSHFSSD